MLKTIQFAAAPAILGLAVAMCPLVAAADEYQDPASFEMVVSAGAKTCLPNASGSVRVFQEGGVEAMEVSGYRARSEHRLRFFCHSGSESSVRSRLVSGRYHDR